MESEKKINWLSLFIRAIIIFIFILIIIWLFTKIFKKDSLSDTFKSNINNMETVSIEYFKTIDLPLEKGESIKVTLKELIEKDLITLVVKDNSNKCDTEKSYSQITREKDQYMVTTSLKCGKEENTIKKSFSLKDCKNCNASSNKPNTSNTNDSSNNQNSSTESSTTTPKKTYYEYVKETTSYSKWMRGPKTGSNIENKYEYYRIAYDEYYTIGILPKGQKSITYVLKLDKVPNNKYYFTLIEEVNAFTKSEEAKYLENSKTSIFKGETYNENLSSIAPYSLTSSDFTYRLFPYYLRGSFYIRVEINFKGTTSAQSYYDSKLKKDVYLIPLKVKVRFSSDIIEKTKPSSGEYVTMPYYRYVTVKRDVVWSEKDYLEGYTKTGKTKVE